MNIKGMLFKSSQLFPAFIKSSKLAIFRRIEYNNERRVAKIQSASRRRLEGKGRSKSTAATPAHSRPGSAALETGAKDDGVELENVRFRQLGTFFCAAQ